MQPDKATREEWIKQYNEAPLARTSFANREELEAYLATLKGLSEVEKQVMRERFFPTTTNTYTGMQPDKATREEWIRRYNEAPIAKGTTPAPTPTPTPSIRPTLISEPIGSDPRSKGYVYSRERNEWFVPWDPQMPVISHTPSMDKYLEPSPEEYPTGYRPPPYTPPPPAPEEYPTGYRPPTMDLSHLDKLPYVPPGYYVDENGKIVPTPTPPPAPTPTPTPIPQYADQRRPKEERRRIYKPTMSNYPRPGLQPSVSTTVKNEQLRRGRPAFNNPYSWRKQRNPWQGWAK